jgi:hypothetical protein
MRKSLLVTCLLFVGLVGLVAPSYAVQRTVLGELFTSDG